MEQSGNESMLFTEHTVCNTIPLWNILGTRVVFTKCAVYRTCCMPNIAKNVVCIITRIWSMLFIDGAIYAANIAYGKCCVPKDVRVFHISLYPALFAVGLHIAFQK